MVSCWTRQSRSSPCLRGRKGEDHETWSKPVKTRTTESKRYGRHVAAVPTDPYDQWFVRWLLVWSDVVDKLLASHFTTNPPIQPGSPLAECDALCQPHLMSNEAHLALSVAIDNLHCARSLIVVGEGTDRTVMMRTYGPFSLLRAALENACRVSWLLSPADPTERIRRRLQALLVSNHGRDQVYELEGLPKVGLDHDGDFLDNLRSAGVDVDVVLKGRRISPTSIVMDGGDSMEADKRCQIDSGKTVESAWRGMSGQSHGDLWASMSLPSRRILQDAVPPSEDQVPTIIHMTPRSTFLWARITTQAVQHATRLYDRNRLAWRTTEID